jgi:hypothetical protein
VKKERLPSFVKFNETDRAFIISPRQIEELNLYPIQVDLVDPFNSSSTYFFTIELYNPSLLLKNTIRDNYLPVLALDNKSISNNSGMIINEIKIVISRISRDG